MPLQLVASENLQKLTAILKDADEGMERILRTIEDDAHTSYLALDASVCVGAVVMRWQPDESEIIYLAVAEAYRGRGYGKACIGQIREEAQRRQSRSLVVGTANSSLENIVFYQKCGFRMDSVRRDYFSYLATPLYEQGILMRDMLVFRMEL